MKIALAFISVGSLVGAQLVSGTAAELCMHESGPAHLFFEQVCEGSHHHGEGASHGHHESPKASDHHEPCRHIYQENDDQDWNRISVGANRICQSQLLVGTLPIAYGHIRNSLPSKETLVRLPRAPPHVVSKSQEVFATIVLLI